MSGRLAGKRAVVFGAGSVGPGLGNGKAAAIVFAREGARVACVDRAQQAADETVDLIKDQGGEALAFAADVTVADDVVRVVAEVEGALGAIDSVHYNVGINRPGDAMAASLADWRDVFAANLEGAFLVSQACIPAMRRAGGGAFTFVSSIAATSSTGYSFVSYEASKAALNRFAQSVAVAHAVEGIRANVVMPGLIDTPHVTAMVAGKATAAEGLAERRAAATPMKRQGSAWDVAHAAAFLVSDEAQYITGACLPVDGGLSLTVPSA